MKKTIWVAIAVMAIAFFSSSAQEVNAQSSTLPLCGVVVDNTTLKTDCEGPLVVAADNVHVNLAGHRITCNGDTTRDGIEIINRTKVRINNGVVESCRTGIFVGGGGEHHLEQLQVNNHSFRGIEIASNEGTRLTNIETIGNAQHGVLLRTGENYVSALTSRDNGIGLGITQDNNVVTSSEFTANRRIGIVTGFSATGNTIQSNTATLNGEEGIRIDQSNNVVRSNKVHYNVLSGIWIRGNDNVVQANHVLDNGEDGIRVGARIFVEAFPTPTGNIIQANTALGNVRFDLADSPTGPCTLNTWKANKGEKLANGCEGNTKP
jgi:parallel beta-helix repeat protein